jgi:protein-tyrosine phosphatase
MGQRKRQSILFLCTGNYYRSRFAEILFNAVAERMGLPWTSTSRGLALERGVNNVGPMEVSAIRALEARRVRAGEQVARFPMQVSLVDLKAANRIIALQQAEHLPLLQERFPTWAEKVEFWHVEDGPEALDLIEREVMDLIARLLGGGERQEAPTLASVPEPEAPRRKPTVRVGRETKGRRGKGVTIISDLPLDEAGLREVAAELKQRCGTGGTIRDGCIEIQGDQRERLVAELERRGYQVKRSGG